MPAIDVVLPVYNGQKYLEQSILSVLNQSFEDFRLYIINDCSSDESDAIIRRLLVDNKIDYEVHKKNRGLFPTLNHLIRKSDAPLIHLWAQDDTMHPDFLQTVTAFHQEYPQISFSYTAVNIIDEEGKILPTAFTDYTPAIIPVELHDKIALYTGSIAGNICNVTIKRKAIEVVGLFDENMKMSGDFDMWVKLTENAPIGRVAEPLINLRNHSNQLSRQLNKKFYSSMEDLKIYDRLLHRLPPETWAWGSQYFTHKLTYYFSLAIQMLLKGHPQHAFKLLAELNKRKNLISITTAFVSNKRNQKAVVTDNKFLFESRPVLIYEN